MEEESNLSSKPNPLSGEAVEREEAAERESQSVVDESNRINPSSSTPSTSNLNNLLFNSKPTDLTSLFTSSLQSSTNPILNPSPSTDSTSNLLHFRRTSFTPTGQDLIPNPNSSSGFSYYPNNRSGNSSSSVHSLDEESLKQHNLQQEELEKRRRSPSPPQNNKDSSISNTSVIQEDQESEQEQEQQSQTPNPSHPNFYQSPALQRPPSNNLEHSRQPSSSTSQSSSSLPQHNNQRSSNLSSNSRPERLSHYQRKENASHRMLDLDEALRAMYFAPAPLVVLDSNRNVRMLNKSSESVSIEQVTRARIEAEYGSEGRKMDRKSRKEIESWVLFT